MKVNVTLIILSTVSHKINDLAIEQAISKFSFPSALENFEKLSLGIIVREDNIYPEEHYYINNTLYIALQFDPKQVLALPTEAVTQMICEKFTAYLPTVSVANLEEREYTMME